MKKLITVLLCLAVVLSSVAAFTACTKKTYDIAIVTDVGMLMDKGFNQGTYEGAKAYAEATTSPTNTTSRPTAPTLPTTTVSTR
ncbi:MAG: hypothetical protein IKI41_02335 [Clostridia bacterium]|nr:hypothetical protein [Clostridia bacterium]